MGTLVGSRKREALGFTLVELLIVVVIIAVLAAIAVPIFLNQKRKAELSATQSSLGTIASMLSNGQSTGGSFTVTQTEMTLFDATGSTMRVVVPPEKGTRVSIGATQGTAIIGTPVAGAWCVSMINPEGGFISQQAGETKPNLNGSSCYAGNALNSSVANGGGSVASSPTALTAVAGDASAALSWAVPSSDGGTEITNYLVTTTPGGATCASVAPTTTCTVTGLTNGTGYTFVVKAQNTVGWSDVSTPSLSVTPYGALGISYDSQTFVSGSNNATLAVTVEGGYGTKSYAVTSGTLPTGVTFNEATGVFTGPASSAWNYTSTELSAGNWFTCAVTPSGGAKCWGDNAQGQGGNGSVNNSRVPVDVVGLTSGVASIAAGYTHTCAVTTAGGAKCWGENANAELGNGTLTNSSVPVDVTGLTSGVASITAGTYHTCAVTTAGGAKCWGYNYWGGLGNGSSTQSGTPVNVTGLTSGVASISAGTAYTCALTTAGGVKCWGNNAGGRLGNGTVTASNVPVNVTGLTSGVASITAGDYHACAVTTAGGVKCWGMNNYGQLGNGTLTNSSVPVDVTGLTSGVASVMAGEYHTCAVTTAGGVKCWGSGEHGRLGNGTVTNSSVPVDVTGLTSGVATIAVGGRHACAVITTTGGAKCWGNAGWGQLGNGAITNSSVPVDVTGLTGQPGFPATLNVAVTDASGTVAVSVTLTAPWARRN